MRLLLICAAAMPLGACHASWEHNGAAIDASGTGAARSFAASNFDGVALRGSDDVDIRLADNFSVKAEGSPKVLDLLDIRVDGHTLVIGRKPSSDWSFGDHGARITVTLPRLTAADVSGSGNMTIDHAAGDFAGSISGSGDLRVDDLKGGAATLSVSGSGNMTVAGKADSLKADTAGSGDIDAKGLSVAGATVSVTGSGGITGTVNGAAEVSIVGSGDVDLGGGAKCHVSTVGSGSARCG